MPSPIFNDDELLMLSGIQHIAFCERQWALIHIEQQWNDNQHTVEGYHLHEKTDDPLDNDTRYNIITQRAVSLISRTLGLYGRADVIELFKTEDENLNNTIRIKGKQGNWKVVPVEYKRGKPKSDECDKVQLCAQAMCLEEMYNIHLHRGFLYYGKTRRRYEVEFSEFLRSKVIGYSKRMHELFAGYITPLPVYKLHCKSCSLIDICLPKAITGIKCVNEYLKRIVLEDQDT